MHIHIYVYIHTYTNSYTYLIAHAVLDPTRATITRNVNMTNDTHNNNSNN